MDAFETYDPDEDAIRAEQDTSPDKPAPDTDDDEAIDPHTDGEETDADAPDHREEVKSWINTFKSEWETGERNSASVPANIRDQLTGLVEDAFVAVRHTIKYAQSESLKFKAASWVLDSLLNDKSRMRVDDPIFEMVEEMKKMESERGK